MYFNHGRTFWSRMYNRTGTRKSVMSSSVGCDVAPCMVRGGLGLCTSCILLPGPGRHIRAVSASHIQNKGKSRSNEGYRREGIWIYYLYIYECVGLCGEMRWTFFKSNSKCVVMIETWLLSPFWFFLIPPWSLPEGWVEDDTTSFSHRRILKDWRVEYLQSYRCCTTFYP